MPPKVVKKTAPTANKNAPKATQTKSTKPAAKSKTEGNKKTLPAGKQAKAASAPAKPKEKVWTKEDDAARKIQTEIRRFLAKKDLQKKKKAKKDYEDLMDKLENEAYVKVIKMQQEQAEKEREKEDKERRQRQEQIKRQKRMLESAFDGDSDEIKLILKEVEDIDNQNDIGHDVIGRAIRAKHQLSMVECEDANNNTPLSEASSGGSTSTVKMLIDLGADPNTVGQFSRTPLYRAAFAGHLEVCEILLQHGADPRLTASDGQRAQEIASVPAITAMLEEWDISSTESILEKIEVLKEDRRQEDRLKREAEMNKIENKISEAQKEYSSVQKALNNAYCELEKRIQEHDIAVSSGFTKTDITEQVIHDAEFDLETCKMSFEKAQDRLSQLKMELREQQLGNKEADGEGSLPGIKVNIKELDDVLLRDVGNKIKDSGKWPLLIDTSCRAATFLRYRDTNYLNAISPSQMEPNKIRLALLGAIRFGKMLIIDMMEVDMFDTITDRFSEVHPNLMEKIQDKSILQEENYLSLVKKEDGEEYTNTRFCDSRTQNFKFVVITKNPYPPESLLDVTYPLRIVVSM